MDPYQKTRLDGPVVRPTPSFPNGEMNMRSTLKGWHTRLFTGLLVCGLAMPVIAQERSDNTYERDDSSAQQDRQQRDREQQDRYRPDRQKKDQDVRLRPTGWITIGVDYDKDGRFEAVERIYAFDLETAREQSKRRQERSERSRRGRDQRTVSIEGELRDMQEIRMRDEDATYVVARVRTDQGRTAKVLLGKDEQLSKLDLNEGKQIQIEGRTGSVNRQAILVASKVRSGDKQVTIQPKQRPRKEEARGKTQIYGSVIRTRSANFRGHEGTFLVAEIRTEDGRQLVNMGPKDKFDDVEFGDVGEIRVTGHKGTISGQDALIAEQVRVDDETIKVKPDKRRDQQWRKEQREREARDRDGETRERRLRDRQIRDRLDRQSENRDGRILDRRDRDGRLLERRDDDDRRFDREERDTRFRDRGERERRLRDDEGRNRRFLDRGTDDDERGERERTDREGEDRERQEREHEGKEDGQANG